MRPPRRAFATPLVLTFACSSSTKEQEPIHINPPAPQHDAAEMAPEPVEPPPHEHPHTINPPPPTQPLAAQTERSWTLMMRDGKCQVFDNDSCPHVPAGQPIPPCNPPPPQDYACPANVSLANGGSERIVQHAGDAVCMIPPSIGGGNCPPNMHCNPPPPREVPCPK